MGSSNVLAVEPYSTTSTLAIPSFENTDKVLYAQSEGVGTSKTRDGAVFKSLEEALSRQGTEVSADIRLQMEAECRQLGRTTSVNSRQSVSSDFSRSSSGLIRWWGVSKEGYDGKLYEIHVTAIIAKVKSGAVTHLTRKTVVVLPFKVNSSASVSGSIVGDERIASLLSESLTTQLTASRKFAILDASFTAEINAAAAQTSSDGIERALSVASRLGADYAISGIADRIAVEIRHIGSLQVPLATGFITLRVVDVHSRQVVLANRYPVRDMSGLNLNQADNPEAVIAAAASSLMSERILSTIYPLRVVAVNGSEGVTLNRGGEDIQAGMLFDVYNVGEELRDPSSGESLGLSERKVALIRITQVTAKVSQAMVITSSEGIELSAVCRKIEQPHQTKQDVKNKKASDLFN